MTELARDGFARAPIRGLDLPDAPSTPVRDVLAAGGDLAALARSRPLVTLATELLGAPAFCVRASLFAKGRGATWSVPWHQDRAVQVAERRDARGFTGWTVKAGTPHAMAPASVLHEMVALRVHLDDCGPEAGPLEIVPGSHREVLDEAGRAAWSAHAPTIVTAQRGEVLAMRPLVLHRSASPVAPVAPVARRVLHAEYAAAALPDGLRWRYGA